MAAKNTNDFAVETGNQYFEAGQATLMSYGGDAGYTPKVAVAWMVPATDAGLFQIDAVFTGQNLDGAEPGKEIHLYVKRYTTGQGNDLVGNLIYPVYWSGVISGFAGRAVNNYEDATGTAPKLECHQVVRLSADDRLHFLVDNTAPYLLCGMDITITAVPEPSTLVSVLSLLATGALGFVWCRRRR